MRKNANEIIYDEVSIFGTPALFTDWRVDRASVPDGLTLYEVRHADEDWGDPCQIAHGILVNFYGTILTAEPLKLPDDGYLDFESEDWAYAEGMDTCATVDEFLRKYGAREGRNDAQHCV